MLTEKNKYGTILWKFYIQATGIISPETFSLEMGAVAALRGTPFFQLQDMHLGRDMPSLALPPKGRLELFASQTPAGEAHL